MQVSVVVLTRDRCARLKLCIADILEKTTVPMELIVVDNGSKDDTRAYLNALSGIKHISLSQNYGVWARNLGFELSKGEFIAQIDDDVRVHAGWFEHMASHMSDDVIAVGPQGLYKDLSWGSMGNEMVNPGEYCDILTGFCWLMRNKGYRYDKFWRDEVLFWHEESEIQFQMRAGGWRFKRCGDVATHASMRTGDVDWEVHNKALAFVNTKWKPREAELHFERRAK